MIINKTKEVPETAVSMPGAEKVSMRILVGPDHGSDTIIMRSFVVQPGGHTPHHSHDFEHVVRVQRGGGIVLDENGAEHPITVGDSVLVEKNKEHQFRNPGDEPFEFICVILNQDQS